MPKIEKGKRRGLLIAQAKTGKPARKLNKKAVFPSGGTRFSSGEADRQRRRFKSYSGYFQEVRTKSTALVPSFDSSAGLFELPSTSLGLFSEEVVNRSLKPSAKAQNVTSRLHPVPAGLIYAPGLEAMVRRSEQLARTARQLSNRIIVSVTVPTMSGLSLRDAANARQLVPDNVDSFRIDPAAARLATEALSRRGFEVVAQTDFSLIVSAPAKILSGSIRETLCLHARRDSDWAPGFYGASYSLSSPEPHQLFIAPKSGPTATPCPSLPEVETFIFSQPPQPLHATPNHVRPKPQNYFTADEQVIRAALNVPPGYEGEGITIAVVDSGFFPHPYYAANKFRYTSMPTSLFPNPEDDSVYGHGTAITSNVFAVAPKVTVVGYKYGNPLYAAFECAAKSNAQIISCSWCTANDLYDPLLHAAILSAIKKGKIVIFAAGNGQQAWPGSLSEVLSIGGVHRDEFGTLQASDYASGYLACTGRMVPDFCGLCGLRPAGVYIMMPTQPGSQLDTQYNGAPYPHGDETVSGSGWAGASGTSSAAPMVAGVVALLLEKAASLGIVLGQEDVRQILAKSARPVTSGASAMGSAASSVRPNAAVGHGLVDAEAALNLLK